MDALLLETGDLLLLETGGTDNLLLESGVEPDVIVPILQAHFRRRRE